MQRSLIFLAAVMLAVLSIGTAGFASGPFRVSFQLKPADAGSVSLSVRTNEDRAGNWSNRYRFDELRGLTAGAFAGPTMAPARFSLDREAGRLDCDGMVGGRSGAGRCDVTANPAFNALLETRGIGRPTLRDTYQLTMASVSRSQVEALAAAHYPRPTIGELVGLGIFHVTDPVIRGLAEVGYALASVKDLIAFQIHGVTPGYIRSFMAAGYRDLPADRLVAMRIFGVQPADIQALRARGIASPTTDQLVQHRLFGGPRTLR